MANASSDAQPIAVAFGTYDTTIHPRTGVLCGGLKTHGWTVKELNVPLGLSTADKVRAAGSLGGTFRAGARLLKAWARLVLKRWGVGPTDVVLVGYMGHFDVHLARLLFPRKLIVLDHMVGLADTVRDRQLGGGFRLRLLDLVDRWALRTANVVVVDTDLQGDELPTAARTKAITVPVGADDSFYAAGASQWATASRPNTESQTGAGGIRVIFYGLYTPLQGAPTIGAAIANLAEEPEIRFTMVGSGQDLHTTRTLAVNGNVEWIDWVEADGLPELVSADDICLGVFGQGPKTQRVIPNKVYQGMAAGCAVVTADTPAMRAGIPSGAYLGVPVGDPMALAEALARLANKQDELADLRAAATAAADAFRPGPTTGALHALLSDRRGGHHRVSTDKASSGHGSSRAAG